MYLRHPPFLHWSLEVGDTPLRDAFHEAVTAAGIDPRGQALTPHSLRHSFGSRLVLHGFSVQRVRKLLGHSKISTTLDIYTHEFESLSTHEDQRIAAQDEAEFGGNHSGNHVESPTVFPGLAQSPSAAELAL